MRRAAEGLVAAFIAMDIDQIMAFRTPDCVRHIYPKSLGHAPQDFTTTARSFERLRTVFKNFHMAVDDIMEDPAQRKVVLWLHVRADTMAGEYVNEYVWRLKFGAEGTEEEEKIVEWWEFVDAGMKDFFPKLMAAYAEIEKQKGGEGTAT